MKQVNEQATTNKYRLLAANKIISKQRGKVVKRLTQADVVYVEEMARRRNGA